MRCTALRDLLIYQWWRVLRVGLTCSLEVGFVPACPNDRIVSVCSQPIRWSGPFHRTRCPWRRSTPKVRVQIRWVQRKPGFCSDHSKWIHIFIVQTSSLVCPSDVTPPLTAAYLEVTDLNSKKVKYIPVPRWRQHCYHLSVFSDHLSYQGKHENDTHHKRSPCWIRKYPGIANFSFDWQHDLHVGGKFKSSKSLDALLMSSLIDFPIFLWLAGQCLYHLTPVGWPKCQSPMW